MSSASDGSNIIGATVTIRGYKILLWNHFGPGMLSPEKTEKEGIAGNDPTEWHRSVLATKSRQLYILPQAIYSCLREAAKWTKKGRFTIQSAMAATLQVEDSHVLIDRFLPKGEPTANHDKPVHVDIQSVRNPNTHGRNIRYRIACSEGWKATFHLLWDKTVVSRNEMQAVTIDAGRLVGLGDGRKIGYGKFNVLSFKVHDRVHPRTKSVRRGKARQS